MSLARRRVSNPHQFNSIMRGGQTDANCERNDDGKYFLHICLLDATKDFFEKMKRNCFMDFNPFLTVNCETWIQVCAMSCPIGSLRVIWSVPARTQKFDRQVMKGGYKTFPLMLGFAFRISPHHLFPVDFPWLWDLPWIANKVPLDSPTLLPDPVLPNSKTLLCTFTKKCTWVHSWDVSSVQGAVQCYLVVA